MVKQIRVFLEEENYNLIKKSKGDLTWEKFMLKCAKKGDCNEKHS